MPRNAGSNRAASIRVLGAGCVEQCWRRGAQGGTLRLALNNARGSSAGSRQTETLTENARGERGTKRHKEAQRGSSRKEQNRGEGFVA
ncbi:hypothetical protein J3B02_006093, partial [Coemansia erecta]